MNHFGVGREKWHDLEIILNSAPNTILRIERENCKTWLIKVTRLESIRIIMAKSNGSMAKNNINNVQMQKSRFFQNR